MRRLGLVAAAVFTAVFTAASAANESPLAVYARPQQRVRLPDGRRLNIHCSGTGGPVTILEGGWTTETNYWFKVQPRLSRAGRVCSYDRAGYGFSDEGPMPRDADAIERDLTALLAAARLPGPVILVAHSLGSYPARLHVDRHRDQVAALVLLDPPVEGADAAYERVHPGAGMTALAAAAVACSHAVIAGTAPVPDDALCLGRPRRGLPDTVNRARAAYQHSAAYQRTAASEITEMTGASEAEVARSRRPWGCLPTIVVTAENGGADPSLTPRGNAAIRAIRWRTQDSIARLSRCSVHHLLPGASHFIPMDNPDAAIRAVTEARAMVQRRASRAG